MLVHVDGAVGSLGGGPIEDRAIAHARDMLARLAEPAQEPAGDAIEIGDADGASGMLTLIFETMRPLGPGSLEEWRRSARELVRGSTASGQSSHQPDEASR
jgi:xanthine/CO dehydrogenase XdhC/CoxF family maturation factor